MGRRSSPLKPRKAMMPKRILFPFGTPRLYSVDGFNPLFVCKSRFLENGIPPKTLKFAFGKRAAKHA